MTPQLFYPNHAVPHGGRVTRLREEILQIEERKSQMRAMELQFVQQYDIVRELGQLRRAATPPEQLATTIPSANLLLSSQQLTGEFLRIRESCSAR